MKETWWFQILGTGFAAAVFNQGAQWLIQRLRDRQASLNHGLFICTKLEAYAALCANAASDIAAYLDNPKHEIEPSFSVPEFEEMQLEAEARYLPVAVRARVLNFPLHVSFHQNYLAYSHRHLSGPELWEAALSEIALVGDTGHVLARDVARVCGLRSWTPSLPGWDFAAVLERYKRSITPS